MTGKVFPAFIELSRPTIEEGFGHCVAAGAKRITVIPVILFAAMHVKEDIPQEIESAYQRYPDLEISYADPFGLHPLMLEILLDRVRVLANGDGLDRTAILLVGRGSSDPSANSNVAKLARLLWEKIRSRWMEFCFIGVTEPSYPEGIVRCLALGAKKIYVIPYFLFTGVLIKRMKEVLEEFRTKHPDVEFHLGDYLGWDRRLVNVLLDRMREARLVKTDVTV